MIRKLALGFLGANALVLAMAAATLAGQHNAPPTIAPTPATSMTMPAITVSTPDIGYVAPARATRVYATPKPILPPLRAADIVPLQRSTRVVLASKRPLARSRLRSAETRHLTEPPEGFATTSHIADRGGRGFL